MTWKPRRGDLFIAKANERKSKFRQERPNRRRSHGQHVHTNLHSNCVCGAGSLMSHPTRPQGGIVQVHYGNHQEARPKIDCHQWDARSRALSSLARWTTGIGIPIGLQHIQSLYLTWAIILLSCKRTSVLIHNKFPVFRLEIPLMNPRMPGKSLFNPPTAESQAFGSLDFTPVDLLCHCCPELLSISNYRVAIVF